MNLNTVKAGLDGRSLPATLTILFFLVPTGVDSQTSVGILDFEARGISQAEATALSDRLRTELVGTDKFRVVERGMMTEILSEQGFQQSGCVSEECIVEVGKLIGVQQIVGGSVSRVGDVFSISARLISVETSEILQTATFDYEGEIENLLTHGMKKIADHLSREDQMTDSEDVIVLSGLGRMVKIHGWYLQANVGPGYFYGNSLASVGLALGKGDSGGRTSVDARMGTKLGISSLAFVYERYFNRTLLLWGIGRFKGVTRFTGGLTMEGEQKVFTIPFDDWGIRVGVAREFPFAPSLAIKPAFLIDWEFGGSGARLNLAVDITYVRPLASLGISDR